MIELENAFKKGEIDVLGLSEIRREGKQWLKRHNGNIFYHYGLTKGYRGVGFYINKRLANQIIEIKGKSERIATLKLKLSPKQILTIIQVYVPTLAAPTEETNEFHHQLDEWLSDECSEVNIVMGDFNAKIGAREGRRFRCEPGNI